MDGWREKIKAFTGHLSIVLGKNLVEWFFNISLKTTHEEVFKE